MAEKKELSPELKVVEQKVAGVVDRKIEYNDLKGKYEDWAALYEHDMGLWGYRAPQVARVELGKILKKDAYILDVCAGTGLIGAELKKTGYKDIDFLDGNEGMKVEAEKKGCYNKYYISYLGHDKLPVKDNVYDAVLLVGALCDGHIKEDCFACFRDFIRITKPGGYFYGGTIESVLFDPYKSNLEKAMEELVQEGLWKWVKKETITDGEHKEAVWILQVC